MTSEQRPQRKAVLVFADQLGIDLAKRRLPQSLRALLDLKALRGAPEVPADVHLFTSGPVPTEKIRPNVHLQLGTTFAARLENAIERVAALGYDEVVMIGRDCPRLNAHDIATAFAHLRDHQLVLGPDHRGGCYLIAMRTGDRRLLHGIRWNRDRDFMQLRARSRAVATLAVKHDLDSWADLRLLARGWDRIARLLRFVLRTICGSLGEIPFFVSLAAQKVRERWQLPPPAFA